MNKEKQFIEEFALYFEGTGFMRMTGRVLAWLLICDPPHQSMNQLVEMLQASKSSISTSTRHLIEARFVERVSLPGERRDYYRLRSNFASASFNRFIARISGFGKFAGQWLSVLEGTSATRLQRLEEMRDMHMLMGNEMPKFLKLWEQDSLQKKGGKNE